MSEIDKVLQYSRAREFERRALPSPPARELAIVACMDARVNPAEILGLMEGDAHVIRNAGGVVTEDVIRSLTISQQILGTKEIMLIHHTGCGMVSSNEEEMKDRIEAECGMRPPFSLGAFPDLEEDVRSGIARIKESPFIAHKDEVRGFVYDLEEGCLREV
ncbi:MAG: beta-class carbonic anhydrase [Actinomycetota bacterium]